MLKLEQSFTHVYIFSEYWGTDTFRYHIFINIYTKKLHSYPIHKFQYAFRMLVLKPQYHPKMEPFDQLWTFSVLPYRISKVT